MQSNARMTGHSRWTESECYRREGGKKFLATKLADSLRNSIRFNRVVSAITVDKDCVKVTTISGEEFEADDLVLLRQHLLQDVKSRIMSTPLRGVQRIYLERDWCRSCGTPLLSGAALGSPVIFSFYLRILVGGRGLVRITLLMRQRENQNSSNSCRV
jgi:hypothetical protein